MPEPVIMVGEMFHRDDCIENCVALHHWIGCSDCVEDDAPPWPVAPMPRDEVLNRFFVPGTTSVFCDNCCARL